MCGITGLLNRLGPTELSVARRMHDAQQHRGPDGEGCFQEDGVCLLHRRLSIVDLKGGAQPLFSEDGGLVLIANGEIYNHVELREQLLARGHRFSTHSDCEVIVHLFEERGQRCVDELRGMFAFAIWDRNHGRLTLARDRMGEKPLCYYHDERRFLFASELGSLLASGVIPKRLDPVAIDRYFHYGYVPEPQTPIQGVRKLDAATVLTLEVSDWKTSEHQYWSLTDASPLDGDPDERIRAELESIAKIVIRADVPVGVSLSGGVDSSLIATMAAREYPGTLEAFTIGYPGRPRYDERKAAQELADHLGLPLREIEVSTGDMTAGFSKLIGQRDDPIANIAGAGFASVMESAQRSGVPVLLLGQGGDELFWGYDWVLRSVLESERKQRQEQIGWDAMFRYLNPLNNGLLPRKLLSAKRVVRAIRGGWRRFVVDRSSPTGQLVFYDLSPCFQEAEDRLARVYNDDFRASISQRAHELFTFPTAARRVDLQVTDLICRTYLRQDGIAQADRLSMAHSVELRLPLVDHKLVETVVGLRKACRDDRLEPKARLRSAIKSWLPASVLARKKRGFEPPIREWYAALFGSYGSLLPGGYLVESGILSPWGAAELSAGHCPRRVVHSLAFKALVLEIWCRRLLESESVECAA